MHAASVSDRELNLSLAQIPPPASLSRQIRNPAAILDLTRLPVEMHEVLQITLLMPLGALVTAVFRTLIGIRTFGTFTPTCWPWPSCSRTGGRAWSCSRVVIVLGLLTRTLLDRSAAADGAAAERDPDLGTLCIVLRRVVCSTTWG